MNYFLRYKWSAVVAAGLHGALFLSTPHVRIISDPVIKHSEPQPPEPVDVIQVKSNDDNPAGDDAPAPVALARPEIPETPPPPIADRSLITIPIQDRRSLQPITEHLRVPGRDDIGGVADGIGTAHGLINQPKDLDRIPRATAQAAPDYPPAMRQSGETGSVIVEFDVDPSGRVVRAEAVRCSRREFAAAAVRAVLRWHFEPGKRHGQAVPFRMAVPIEFGLDTGV